MTIYLPAVNKRVSIGQYVQAVKKAKENPDAEFRHTLETWWPGTGREVVQQFRKGIHDRINKHLNR